MKNDRDAVLWTKIIHTDSSYDLDELHITHTPRTYIILSTISYDSNDAVTDIRTIPSYAQEALSIPPGSFIEGIWHLIWRY